MTNADPREPFIEAERRKMLEAKTIKDAKRIRERQMTRDEHLAKCIEAIDNAVADNFHLSSRYEFARRILFSLHDIARVNPIEATEEMIRAGGGGGGWLAVTWNAMSAAGDLTNPPEKKPC